MIAVSESLKGRHFTRVADWSRDELESVLDLGDELKELQQRREEHHLLPGRALGMIFQKPSTRTRVSFEVGIAQLGGHGLYLAASDLQLGRGETLRDTATVLSRYLDGLMIRTFVQEDVEELARHASIPVINGLTDSSHPCQALADVMTVRERFYRYERRFGSFTRTIGLPHGTDEGSIRAEYKDGVLEIHVAKPEEPKPRRIQIGGGSQATIEGSTSEET